MTIELTLKQIVDLAPCPRCKAKRGAECERESEALRGTPHLQRTERAVEIARAKARMVGGTNER